MLTPLLKVLLKLSLKVFSVICAQTLQFHPWVIAPAQAHERHGKLWPAVVCCLRAYIDKNTAPGCPVASRTPLVQIPIPLPRRGSCRVRIELEGPMLVEIFLTLFMDATFALSFER